MNSIEVNSLTKRFGNFISVDNISFNVTKGEIFGFLGANGAGKSTTIKMLCGILAPTSGDAIVGGFSVDKEPDKVKNIIGYMSQKFSLYNDLTVSENIDFFGGIYNLDSKKLKQRKSWVLKAANLEGNSNALTGSLPVGIKQRLALSTAVIHEPKIVFLDEPTGGVDPISRRNFWDMINELSSLGITVFVTTHYLDEAEFCNSIVMLNAGKVIAKGSSKELKTTYLKNPIFEIECNKPVELLEFLGKQEAILETSIFGNYIHALMSSANATTEDLRALISNNNFCRIDRIERITPTLEDVFIYLLNKGISNEK